MTTRALLAALVAAVALAACRTGRNYDDPGAPRHAGAPRGGDVRAATDTLRVVSFNTAFARRLDAAMAMLDTHTALRGADVVLLQEMTGDATRRVAQALGLHWVYYPAI